MLTVPGRDATDATGLRARGEGTGAGLPAVDRRR